MIRLLKEMDGRANMKMESNIKDQNKNFETQRVKMKTTPNFKDQKLLVSNTCIQRILNPQPHPPHFTIAREEVSFELELIGNPNTL